MEHPPELVERIYAELRKLAAAQLRNERPGHTLQATALAHEAYLRMAAQRGAATYDRGQFLSMAATMIRRILVDHARAKARLKRGAGKRPVTWVDGLVVTGAAQLDLLDLHDALERLALLDEREAAVVELRFFGGLSVKETAAVLGVSTRTVDTEWRAARAWLRRELG